MTIYVDPRMDERVVYRPYHPDVATSTLQSWITGTRAAEKLFPRLASTLEGFFGESRVLDERREVPRELN